MGLRRRKATGRREPRFDIFPIPGFNLRLSARDRAVPAEEDKPARRGSGKRKQRAAAEETRPLSRRSETKAEAEPEPPRTKRDDGGKKDRDRDRATKDRDDDRAKKDRREGGQRRSWFVRSMYWGAVLGLWVLIVAVGGFIW